MSEAETHKFLADIYEEVKRARAKYPNCDGQPMMVALVEEVGEPAKALLDEPNERVYAEAVQVACMALRVATEGDRTLIATRQRRVPPRAA